jgi:hypothetical protein
MPLKYKKSMVKNEKLILDLLPAEDHEKARQQIEEYRQELMNKDSN